jgi:hypothetical protein
LILKAISIPKRDFPAFCRISLKTNFIKTSQLKIFS